MSRKIGTDLDLVKFAIMNAKANPVSSDPAGLTGGDEGLFWVNTTGHKFKFWNGSAVIDFTDLANSSGSLTAARISDFTSAVQALRWASMTGPNADVAFGGFKITGLADGIANSDAATFGQVTALVNNQTFKAAVRVATTANIATLAGGAPNTLDGVSLALNDRILVKDQTTATANGIYTVTALGTGVNGTWARSTDADATSELLAGSIIPVVEGTANGDKLFMLTTNNPITLGSTSLVFSAYGASSGEVGVGGAGMTKTGSGTVTYDVVAGGTGTITVGADSVDVNTARVPIKRTGTVPTTTSTVDGMSITIAGSQVTFNHAQNNPAPDVTIRAGSSPAAGYTAGEVVDMTDVTVDANSVKITLPGAPSANNWVFMVVA